MLLKKDFPYNIKCNVLTPLLLFNLMYRYPTFVYLTENRSKFILHKIKTVTYKLKLEFKL